MKFETLVAGQWVPRYQYKSFEPVPVDHDWVWEDPMIGVLRCAEQTGLVSVGFFRA